MSSNNNKFTPENSLSKYFKEVESVVLLTAEEERNAILEYQSTQDPKVKARLKDKIIKGALRFVIREAHKHHRAVADKRLLPDLIAAGNIGLLRALDKFDVSCNTRFLTYASWWIRHEMREEVRRIPQVHVPSHAMSKGSTMPIPVELSEEIEYDAGASSPTDQVDTYQSVLKLLDTVPDMSVREIFVIKTSFGVDTEPKTLKQIGKLLEITGERVRQLREAALLKLRAVVDRDDD